MTMIIKMDIKKVIERVISNLIKKNKKNIKNKIEILFINNLNEVFIINYLILYNKDFVYISRLILILIFII